MIWAALTLAVAVTFGLGFIAAALCAAISDADDDDIIRELLEDIDLRDARIRYLERQQATR